MSHYVEINETTVPSQLALEVCVVIPRKYLRVSRILLAGAALGLSFNALAQASPTPAPATAQPPFTIAAKPLTLTIAPGKSGSVTVITKISPGYNHALQLTIANVPPGIAVTFTPPVIPAPGAGTAQADITVSKTVAPGTYLLRMVASDGTTSRTRRVTLTVGASGSGTTFNGCLYPKNGHQYQGVKITVANSGTYPFDAVLYHGATCDPGSRADEFGFGQLLGFNIGFTYTFWFTDFGDQLDTSALWYVGTDKSQCVSYATAPVC